MNFKRFHESKNLFDTTWEQGVVDGTTGQNTPANNVVRTAGYIPVVTNQIYSIKRSIVDGLINIRLYASDKSYIGIGKSDYVQIITGTSAGNPMNQTQDFCCLKFIDSSVKYLRINDFTNDLSTKYMMVEGEYTSSTIPPYEPYSSEVWHDIPHYIHKTDTDILTTLPADIYANDTTATVGLKGQMEQSGTPTSTTPIQPTECGDLETTGTYTGQYKIPILSANTTTPVYLGEVQSTRRIKKLVLTGEETAYAYEYSGNNGYSIRDVLDTNYSRAEGYCSHYVVSTATPSSGTTQVLWIGASNTHLYFVGIADIIGTTSANEFKQWLQQQYAAGTPVTVWYVLATEETGIVNEPLRKIGAYADEVSGITIPTIAGANTLSIGTALQPSEVTVNYKGWHPVQSVHERESGQWD